MAPPVLSPYRCDGLRNGFRNLKIEPRQTFGRLTVLSFVERRLRTTRWLCRCECGRETVVFARNLQMGRTKSCGCLSAELARVRNARHGYTRKKRPSREYKTWVNIKSRC